MKNLLALFMLTISLSIGTSQVSYAITQDEVDTTAQVEETQTVKEEVVETTTEKAVLKSPKTLLFTKLSNKNLLKVAHHLWVSFYCVLS